MSYHALGQAQWCAPGLRFDASQGGCVPVSPVSSGTSVADQESHCSATGGAWVNGACFYPGTPGYPGGAAVTPGTAPPSSDPSEPSDPGSSSGGSWWGGSSDAPGTEDASVTSSALPILLGVGLLAVGAYWLWGKR